MDTHANRDIPKSIKSLAEAQSTEEKFFKELEQRADRMRAKGESTVTGGAPGERVLSQWEHKGMSVIERPADTQNILRLSVGGGDTPIEVDYCVFRGDRNDCIVLLRKALRALEHPF